MMPRDIPVGTKAYTLFLVFLSFCDWATAQALDGQWQTDLEHSVVTIKGASGSISSSDNPEYVGIWVLRKVEPAGEQKWTAEIFDPKVKKYFEAIITRKTQDQLHVRASCCWGLFSENYVWKKVKP